MKLILLPNLLSENSQENFITPRLKDVFKSLDILIAESEKEGKRYLKNFIKKDLSLYLLNEHTKNEDLNDLFLQIKNKNVGLISDSGLPCLSDPGAKLVLLCHKNFIEVDVYPGPSSIIFAYMLSGFSSKKFCFYGYLSRKSFEREKEIRQIEKSSLKEDCCYSFIETPYRAQKVFNILIKILNKDCYLSIAIDLTMPAQKIFTKKIIDWRKDRIDLHKKLIVFSIYLNNSL